MADGGGDQPLRAGGLDIALPKLSPNALVRSMEGSAPVLAHLDPTNKINRELFVGNIPPGTTDQVLKDHIYAAMTQTNLLHGQGNPVQTTRINSSLGRFAFLEFRSVEECTSALNLNGIPFMGTVLKIGRPSKYVGPPIRPMTWQELTGQQPDPHVVDPSTKLYRELFVGNTAPGVTAPLLTDFLNAALMKVGLSTEPTIVSTRLNGKFAFIEFKTIESCTAALNLDGIPFMGQMLKISRPSKYDGPPSAHVTWSDMLTTYLATRSPAELLATQTPQPAAAPQPPGEPSNPTPFLTLSNMCSDADLATASALRELKDDTLDECQQYGAVRAVSVLPDKTIVVSFEAKEEAVKAYKAIQGRTFDGNTVGVGFRDTPVEASAEANGGLKAEPPAPSAVSAAPEAAAAAAGTEPVPAPAALATSAASS